VLIAGDEYYKKCVSEPAGSQASWNTRDQHMTTTLLRVQAHLGDPKIIVWAHNSHVGDTTATGRGGVSFTRNETWNLGQVCHYMVQPLVEMYEGCMVVLKVS
jgi:erythromycin esterase-like protein